MTMVRIVNAEAARRAKRMRRASWSMGAFFYTDGRRELRKVPYPPPAIVKVFVDEAPRGVAGERVPTARFFRLRRASVRRERWIYEEFANVT
jgi:hypothetical protein